MNDSFVIWFLSVKPEIFDLKSDRLWPEGFEIIVYESPELLLHNLDSRHPDFVLLDWELIHQNVRPLVNKVVRSSAFSEIYLFNLPEDDEINHELSKWELSGVFSPAYSVRDLRQQIREMADYRQLLNRAGIIGRSSHLKYLASILTQVSPTDATVLISGESGTGKELLARAIHNNSHRRDKPYVSVNCAAISESLLQSELFGHEKGAFTGADRRHAGYFETAAGGTIFLDEIGEFKLDLQARLLHVLEQKTFYRVGGNQQLNAEVRIVCATNRNLPELVQEGKFRADLFYRLSVIQMVTEPLRNRPEDIYPLANYFLSQLSSEIGKLEILPEAVSYMLRYSWPGNVRELKNFIQSTAYLSRDHKIKTGDVEEFIRKSTVANRSLPVATGKSSEQADFELIYRALLNLAREIAEMKKIMLERGTSSATDAGEVYVSGEQSGHIDNSDVKNLRQVEKEMIKKALHASDGQRKKAAELLGIGERTLYRKLKEYDLR